MWTILVRSQPARSTQPSILRGMVNWVSASGLMTVMVNIAVSIGWSEAQADWLGPKVVGHQALFYIHQRNRVNNNNNNNNNNNRHDNVYGAVIVAVHCHCESSPGSSDECSIQRNLRRPFRCPSAMRLPWYLWYALKWFSSNFCQQCILGHVRND